MKSSVWVARRQFESMWCTTLQVDSSAGGPTAVMSSFYFEKHEAERAGVAEVLVCNPALWMVLGSQRNRPASARWCHKNAEALACQAQGSPGMMVIIMWVISGLFAQLYWALFNTVTSD